MFRDFIGLNWTVPVPKAQLQSFLIQNNFRSLANFTTDSEKIQNQLWSDFWIFLNQS